MAVLVFALVLCCILIIIFLRRKLSRKSTNDVAFFHPFCAGRGGGERVLWHSIKSLQSRYGDLIRISIYCADDAASQKTDDIISSAKRCFAIGELHNIHFVKCKTYRLIDPRIYPFLTMIFQNFGSMILGFECLCRYRPGLFIDSTGFAFLYPIARYVFNCRVACYTHYPTISTDMLSHVVHQRPSYNNLKRISSSKILTKLKLYYYRIFAMLYSQVGRCSEVVMVNSSWTRDHIKSLWNVPCSIVYPPCEINDLCQIPLTNRLPWIISVAQFRREKDHMLQLATFALVLAAFKQHRTQIRLVLVGGARNEEDYNLIEELVKQAKELKIEENVDFYINASYDELYKLYTKCFIGIHTMWNEHFGIGVVEYMAAGLVAIAHNSGGPRSDIVVPFNKMPVGYLADGTPQAFCEQIVAVLSDLLKRDDDLSKLRINARAHCQKFSNECFRTAFLSTLEPLFSR